MRPDAAPGSVDVRVTGDVLGLVGEAAGLDLSNGRLTADGFRGDFRAHLGPVHGTADVVLALRALPDGTAKLELLHAHVHVPFSQDVAGALRGVPAVQALEQPHVLPGGMKLLAVTHEDGAVTVTLARG